MTIQRTVLVGLTGLLLTPVASAQCSRVRIAKIYPIHHHYASAFRPVHGGHHVTSHGHTVEIPPSPESITFGGFRHVDALAARLEILMNEVCLDLYYNYSHNPGFSETYAEAYSLYQTVRYIHAAEHHYDRDTVRRRLGGADALLHHIQDDLTGWTRYSHRQIGTLGIITKMNLAEDTLHHLMEDVGVTVTPGLEEPPAPVTSPAPQSLSVVPGPPALP